MKLKKGFYKDYENEVRKNQEEKRFRELYKIPEEKSIIITRNPNKISRILRIVSNIIIFLFKLICYVILTILMSIGVTVLLNQELREYFIKMFF